MKYCGYPVPVRQEARKRESWILKLSEIGFDLFSCLLTVIQRHLAENTSHTDKDPWSCATTVAKEIHCEGSSLSEV